MGHIVGKLCLKDTGPDLDLDRMDDYAIGYTSRAHGHDRREIEHIDTFEESAATGFDSTAAELTGYFQAHLDGDSRLLSDRSTRQMRQVQWTVTDERSYGLGSSISRINGRTCFSHGGGYPGQIAITYVDLEWRLSLSVLTITDDGPAGILATAVLHLIDLALTDKARTEPCRPKELSRYEGRFATLWGVVHIVNVGGRLYLLAPSLPNPAAEAVELVVVSETGLKVVGDKGHRRFNEPMTYVFRKNGSVKEIRAGDTFMPIKDFKLPDRITRPE